MSPSDRTESEPLPGPLEIGDIVGNYVVTGFVGLGGMGFVYRAKHLRLNALRVAIKVMQTQEMADQKLVDRFLLEAETAASIDHSNIVTILDLDKLEDGAPYMIMDLMQGHDLAQELEQNGPMTLERALRLFSGALGGLARAHQMGIVHKDLKPSNLFLKHPSTSDESLCIMDFGVARLMENDALTSAEGPAGTYKFMAPEYVEDTANVSPAIDVYQSGLILIEALTGQMPVVGMLRTNSNLALHQDILDKPALAEFIERSIAWSPEDRYQNATQQREALDALMLSAKIPAPTFSTKICVCGRSATYPMCDNSHDEEGWSCQVDLEEAQLAFCASGLYANVARKLAAAHQGIILTAASGASRVEKLVLILDAADLKVPMLVQDRCTASQTLVVCFGRGGPLLSPHFPGAKLFIVEDDDVRKAFVHVEAILDGERDSFEPQTIETQSIFLSHATRDEPLIMPAVEHLKTHYGADIFTCADSIPAGSVWNAQIMDALRNTDVFVILLSESFLGSTFCAFEIGCAVALNKDIATISLDGTLPPPFVQHLQSADIPRVRRRKPWLDAGDVLIDELLAVMTP